MELRILRYFLAVAREENITKAAELLHITQPTLSRQLAQLEEDVGVTLFSRGARKVTLTDEGMLLRRRAEEIVDLADKTEKELTERDELINGVVSVGCGELASVQVIAEMFRAFKEKKVIYCNLEWIPLYENLPLSPDVLLSDMIKAFHPELLPDYHPVFYSLLEKE